MNRFSLDQLTEPIDGVLYRPDCVEEVDDRLKNSLGDRGWSCRSWTDAPSTRHSPHDHPYSHRVLCVSGWIEFSVENETYRLKPGDALDLPDRTRHSAVTAPDQSTEYWLLQQT